jgi:hypothetical protein
MSSEECLSIPHTKEVAVNNFTIGKAAIVDIRKCSNAKKIRVSNYMSIPPNCFMVSYLPLPARSSSPAAPSCILVRLLTNTRNVVAAVSSNVHCFLTGLEGLHHFERSWKNPTKAIRCVVCFERILNCHPILCGSTDTGWPDPAPSSLKRWWTCPERCLRPSPCGGALLSCLTLGCCCPQTSPASMESHTCSLHRLDEGLKKEGHL